MKKFLILFFILTLFFNTYSFADDFVEEDFSESLFSEVSSDITKEPETHAKNIVVIDRKTLSVLYEKQGYQKVPMASTTKIMTGILVLENTNLEDIVTISKKASNVNRILSWTKRKNENFSSRFIIWINASFSETTVQ